MSDNGRINLNLPNDGDVFMLYDKIPLNENISSYKKALTGNWNDTILSRAYFCDKNIQIIHNAIRATVYKNSKNNYLIGQQNEDTLKIIMRSIFLQYSRNDPNNITQQISKLNSIVVNYCVPKVLGELEGYIKYKRDVSTLAKPMKRPVSTYQSKDLEFKKFF